MRRLLPLPLAVLLACCLALPLAARAEGSGATDYAAKEMCALVKGVLAAGEKAWEGIKGDKVKESDKSVTFKGLLSLMDAKECKLAVYQDGTSFYFCAMKVDSSCKAASKQYEKFTLDMAACVGDDNPKVKSGDGKLTSKWKLASGLLVTTEFKKAGDDCSISFFADRTEKK